MLPYILCKRFEEKNDTRLRRYHRVVFFRSRALLNTMRRSFQLAYSLDFIHVFFVKHFSFRCQLQLSLL